MKREVSLEKRFLWKNSGVLIAGSARQLLAGNSCCWKRGAKQNKMRKVKGFLNYSDVYV